MLIGASGISAYVAARLGASAVNHVIRRAIAASSSSSAHAAAPAIPSNLVNVLAVVLGVATAATVGSELLGRRTGSAAWRKGAEGEERLGSQLRRLERRGFVVLDDLRVPSSPANIDHLVIGPPGVYAVDAKNYSGRVSWSRWNLRLRRSLWHGQHPMAAKLAAISWEADQADRVLAPIIGPLGLTVTPVVCFVGTASLPASRFMADGVVCVAGGRRLARRLRRSRRRLSADAVAAVAQVAEQRLGR